MKVTSNCNALLFEVTSPALLTIQLQSMIITKPTNDMKFAIEKTLERQNVSQSCYLLTAVLQHRQLTIYQHNIHCHTDTPEIL